MKNPRLAINFKDKLFMEFYGALLGDGWMSAYKCGKLKKRRWVIGLSGHINLDKDYVIRIKNIIQKLFNRKGYVKYKPECNGIELNVGHKELINLLNKKLKFPIGVKKNLKIYNKFLNDWNLTKYIIRGIFDTDGCFYLDKTPVGRPYPCISIQMKEPILLNQIYKVLKNKGFKIVYKKNKNGIDRITLKGRKQLDKWMSEIGSSNSKHLNKIKALVAQPGLAREIPNL